MVDLKCKNCAYEFSVAPTFWKGTKEHQCPGCSTSGKVVEIIREGGFPKELISDPISKGEARKLRDFELVPFSPPTIRGTATVPELGEITPEPEASGGSTVEELTRDEAPATPEDPQPSQDPEEDKPRAKKKRAKPDTS